MIEQSRPRAEPMVAAFERIANGVAILVRDHIELARVELRDALRDARLIALAVGVLLAGYILLMLAVAALLAPAISEPAALGLVALANLVAGRLVLRSATAGERAPDANRPPSSSDAGTGSS